MQSVMILGRQSALGLAELESLYGSDKVRLAGAQAAVVAIDPCLLAFDRLGGSIKFAKLLTILDTTNWKQIEKFLLQVSPEHSQRMSEGKMQLGMSLYGFNESPKRILATGLSLKKAIREIGRSVRLIPNKTAALNSAQVLHNHLTGPTGWELIFIRDGNKTIVAQTIKVQDISSYTKRDRERPKRDARVGMLPPKLAQIIMNLAAGTLAEDKLQSICDVPAGQPIPPPLLNQKVLDSFCGSGVIIQEALLMGYGGYGTDIDPRMVEYTKENARWLAAHFPVSGDNTLFEVADATQYTWAPTFDFVATETYLGRPFTSSPNSEILARTIADCNLIIRKFLKNIHAQIKPGTRLCVAIPAWQIKPHRFTYLPLIDQISDLGYNRVSFEHSRDEDLIYYRDDQIVARKLLVIEKV